MRSVHHWPPPGWRSYDVTIEVNEHLVNSFLWHSVADAYKEKGDTRSAMKMHDIVIQGYKDAVDRADNNLI
jgi:hypothetical protein